MHLRSFLKSFNPKILMPVTKTAKRALRSSRRKAIVNKKILSQLEIAIRLARKEPSVENVRKAISLADRAAKRKVIHKKKAGHFKSLLNKLLAKQKKLKSTSRRKKKV